jgi:hypothetical protein
MRTTLNVYKRISGCMSEGVPKLAWGAPNDNTQVGNRGTGAGGAATNTSGLAFEQTTSIIPRLEQLGYKRTRLDSTKNGFTLDKTHETFRVTFVTQAGLRKFFKGAGIFRNPDEAFIVEHLDGRRVLKILEKKNQSGAGSVDSKLALGPYFIEEYQEVLGPDIKVEYAFCLCEFLKKEYLSELKKWTTLRRINERHGIAVFFGEDPGYLDDVVGWIEN